VIFVSGYADSDLLDQDIGEPFAGYMQKPFSPETLLRAVRERLG
jgi:CheY-like chemotaxis protein